MPIIKSAKKRVRTATKAAVRNSKTKRNLKSAVKTFTAALATDKKKASDAQRKAQSAIDTAVKKGVMHKNKAARKKRQLVAAAKKADAPVVATAKKAAKPAVKKTAVKPAAKSTTKKPVAKKAPAKKSTAKK